MVQLNQYSAQTANLAILVQESLKVGFHTTIRFCFLLVIYIFPYPTKTNFNDCEKIYIKSSLKLSQKS